MRQGRNPSDPRSAHATSPIVLRKNGEDQGNTAAQAARLHGSGQTVRARVRLAGGGTRRGRELGRSGVCGTMVIEL